jgi:hypothetical protein
VTGGELFTAAGEILCRDEKTTLRGRVSFSRVTSFSGFFASFAGRLVSSSGLLLQIGINPRARSARRSSM